MISKICTHADIPDIVNMYTEAKTWQNKHQPDVKFEAWSDPLTVDKILSTEGQYLAGTWEDGKMVAAVLGTFWQGVPNWALTNIITNKRTINLNLRKNGIAAATETLIECAESRGYYKFYTLVSERQYRNKRVMNIFQHHIPILQEYIYVTEDAIKPNQNSKFTAFNNILQLRTGPTWSDHTVYIRSATAMNHRRELFMTE
jgi:hypothetical protein